MAKQKQYLAIDLKSFYASVECVERGLDPLDALLVVADESRTDKTICLAVSPALKAYGVPGRPRLFEVKEKIAPVNALRQKRAPGRRFSGKGTLKSAIEGDPSLELDFLIARPRMAYYMEYSRKIVEIYLRYVSMDDLLVYSIDEVFIDATPYLETYRLSAHEFAMKLIREVLKETGVTATAGIGENGVRIAELTERTYRELLWCHRPLTDFWRVGRGIAKKLEEHGLYTMGDVARCSEGKPTDYHNADLLYKLFGVNAELLIDHAWGWEPAEIADCKAYTPESKSLSAGQVLPRPYSFDEGRVVVREMADNLAMELVRKGLVTDGVVLDVNYDASNLSDPKTAAAYRGPVKPDYYGRPAPERAHGSKTLDRYLSSADRIMEATAEIYDKIVDKNLTVRRFNLAVIRVLTVDEAKAANAGEPEQLSLFIDYAKEQRDREREDAVLEKERRMQETLLTLRDKFGKNAVVKGLNLQDGATAMERNETIGGHRK